uniref:Uncharacterized protein n=1 Tax=Rhizophora mucronata TaxID=61149 RepID=A0A2P2NFD6_RHIMU
MHCALKRAKPPYMSACFSLVGKWHVNCFQQVLPRASQASFFICLS